MRRIALLGFFALASAALLVDASPAFALRVAAPPPGPARMKQADVVVVGRVVAFDNKDVQVQKTTYRVALVAVSEMIKGAKKQRMVRVGFVPFKAPVVNPGQPVVIRPIRPGIRTNQLTIGQHGLYFLKKHPQGDFYIAPMYYDYVSSSNEANFRQETTFAKFTMKYGDHPEKALDSKDGDVRYTAVIVMLQEFSRPSGRPPYKKVGVDAKLSKQILAEILNGDWNSNDQWAPMNLFYRLGVNAQDGFINPQSVRGQPFQVYNERRKAAFKSWLTKNLNTYRVKKYVGGKGAGAVPIRPRPPIQIQPVPPVRIQPVPVQPVPGRLIPQPRPLPAPAVPPRR